MATRNLAPLGLVTTSVWPAALVGVPGCHWSPARPGCPTLDAAWLASRRPAGGSTRLPGPTGRNWFGVLVGPNGEPPGRKRSEGRWPAGAGPSGPSAPNAPSPLRRRPKGEPSRPNSPRRLARPCRPSASLVGRPFRRAHQVRAAAPPATREELRAAGAATGRPCSHSSRRRFNSMQAVPCSRPARTSEASSSPT